MYVYIGQKRSEVVPSECSEEKIQPVYDMYMQYKTMLHESSSLTWMGPNQHLLAPQTHNPFFPSDLASLTLVQLGIHQS